MTATELRCVRAARALLAVADYRTDAPEVAGLPAELRALATLLEEREWLRTLPGGKHETTTTTEGERE